MRTLLLAPLVVCGLLAQGSLAQDPEQPDEYLRLSFEAKGRLKVSLDPKSGKVSAVSLSVGKETWWLDFTAKELNLRDEAKKLDGQTVFVTGEFLPNVVVQERSTEPLVRRSFDWPTLRVKTLEAAGKKK
jgi:hypothetical protein